MNVPERKAGDLQKCFLEAVLPRDPYRARTCKLKSDGTKALQHLPPYAQKCMWQDSRWCTNVKRICLDLFLQWIPQAAFTLRKAQVHYNTPQLTFVNGDSTKLQIGLQSQAGHSQEDKKGKVLAGLVSIQSNLCWFFSNTYKISTVKIELGIFSQLLLNVSVEGLTFYRQNFLALIRLEMLASWVVFNSCLHSILPF